MKNILVTGGLGYIGAHTVVELINSGYTPIVVDNLSNTTVEVKERIEKISAKELLFYEADVNDSIRMAAILKQHAVDAVIHFAAYKAVGESVAKPLKYYSNNIGGLCALLNAMDHAGVKHIVFSSSCTVYGEPDSSPVDETSPVKKATSPYGNTKQIGEEILFDCKHLHTVALRYFNPIGAHASALIGELPLGVPNNLVPFITQTAAGIREKLTVFGSDYNTSDGTCVRDYIHVCDLAVAHVKALSFLEQRTMPGFDVFNIGTGTGYTVLEIIKAFETVNNIKLPYTIGARRSGDVEKVWADAGKAKRELGWQAELDLNEMVRSAWAWQLQLQNQS